MFGIIFVGVIWSRLTQCTIDLLGKFFRNSFHRGQIFHAGFGDASDTSKALQEFRTPFAAHTRDVF